MSDWVGYEFIDSSASSASAGEYRPPRLSTLAHTENDEELVLFQIPAPIPAHPPLYLPNPFPRNSTLRFHKSQTPILERTPTAVEIQHKTPIKLIGTQQPLVEENMEIFKDLLNMLIAPMEDAVARAVRRSIRIHGGKHVMRPSPQHGDGDGYRLVKTMRDLGKSNFFAINTRRDGEKITEAVFDSRIAVSHPQYSRLLGEATRFLSAIIWFCGPDMIDCPPVLAHANEYLKESGNLMVLMPASTL